MASTLMTSVSQSTDSATTTLSTPTQVPTPAPGKQFTVDECTYFVNTSSSQKALFGFMATSLIINFGILIWWFRMFWYKRKQRKDQLRRLLEEDRKNRKEEAPEPDSDWESEVPAPAAGRFAGDIEKEVNYEAVGAPQRAMGTRTRMRGTGRQGRFRAADEESVASNGAKVQRKYYEKPAYRPAAVSNHADEV